MTIKYIVKINFLIQKWHLIAPTTTKNLPLPMAPHPPNHAKKSNTSLIPILTKSAKVSLASSTKAPMTSPVPHLHYLRLNRSYQSHRHERSQRFHQSGNARLWNWSPYHIEPWQHSQVLRCCQRNLTLLHHHRIL